jgi:hypothetical protein
MGATIAAVKVQPDAQLRACPEFRIGIGMPAPLSGRLDGLVELADSEGASTSRKELLAALLLAAPEKGAELADLVRRYRTASVAEAMIAGQADARFLRLERRPPGPRARGPN